VAEYLETLGAKDNEEQRNEELQKMGPDALVDAAEGNDATLVRELIAAGFEVNHSRYDEKYQTSETALFIAANFGHQEVVQILIDASADVNKTETSFGWAPLKCAAYNGHLQSVKALVAAKAEVDRADDFGYTCLNYATEPMNTNEQTPVVEYLLSVGASMGPSTLVDAAIEGDAKKAQKLLAAGADVNYSNSKRQIERTGTALLIAAERGHLEVVQVLVDAAADVNKANDSLYTPLDMAKNHPEVVRYLKSVGAKDGKEERRKEEKRKEKKMKEERRKV
jgi:ankyrin repeat protein